MDVSRAIELLQIQGEGLVDRSGRMVGSYGIAIACAGERRIVWVGSEVPDHLAAELKALLGRPGPERGQGLRPPELDDCRRLLEVAAGRPVRSSVGLVFVIPAHTRFRSPGRIERSDASLGEGMRDKNPGNWHPVEWNELLDGRLGPWTMALDGGLVVSICHTSRPATARGAECGVWTRPGFRGRGYAAAVTAAWADVMRPTGRHLFYCCDEENLSSQRVAGRLNLLPIGRTWELAAVREPDDRDALHPLSALRRRA